MEDKELKKKLAKIPDVDKNGDPIFKIADVSKSSGRTSEKSGKTEKRVSK
jgi:hypothetical protein